MRNIKNDFRIYLLHVFGMINEVLFTIIFKMTFIYLSYDNVNYNIEKCTGGTCKP